MASPLRKRTNNSYNQLTDEELATNLSIAIDEAFGMSPKFGDTKETFETGAQRDSQEAKPRPDLFSAFAEERVGWVSAHGAKHYGDRNWEKGMKASRFLASMGRHWMGLRQGDHSEDHLAQLVWNGMALLDLEEKIRRGLLPAELDDRPSYMQGQHKKEELGMTPLDWEDFKAAFARREVSNR